MRPSFLKKRGTLEPAWRFASEGIIWRVVAPSARRLVGESRNADKKEVGFFCVDLETGTPLWKGKTFGEQWWIGIEACAGAVVFLHKYATPSLPEHKSILAVDVEGGELLWSRDDLTFEFLTHSSVFGSQRTVRGVAYQQLDVHTGALMQVLTEEEAIEVRRQTVTRNPFPVELPEPILDLALDNSGTATVIRNACDLATLVGPVEFLEKGSLLIFNHHEQASSSDRSGVNNILKIVDSPSGAILFEKTVNTHTASIARETFFVQENMLVYIHEQTTLAAVDLAGRQLQ